MTDSNLTFNQEEDNDEVIQESIRAVSAINIGNIYIALAE